MKENRGILGVGLGMAGSGAFLVAISLLLADGFWFLVTGTVFALIGIVMVFNSKRAG
jgi:hypothetical protein